MSEAKKNKNYKQMKKMKIIAKVPKYGKNEKNPKMQKFPICKQCLKQKHSFAAHRTPILVRNSLQIKYVSQVPAQTDPSQPSCLSLRPTSCLSLTIPTIKNMAYIRTRKLQQLTN